MFQLRQPLRTLSGNEQKDAFLIFDEGKMTTAKPPKMSKKSLSTSNKWESESTKKIYSGIIKMQNVIISKLMKKVAFLTLVVQCKKATEKFRTVPPDSDAGVPSRISPFKKMIVTPKKRRYDESDENTPSATTVPTHSYNSPPRTRGYQIPSTPPSGTQAATPSSHGRLKARKAGLISSQLHSFESPIHHRDGSHSPTSHLTREHDHQKPPINPHQMHATAIDETKRVPVPTSTIPSSNLNANPVSNVVVSSLEARMQQLENNIRLLSIGPMPFPGPVETFRQTQMNPTATSISTSNTLHMESNAESATSTSECAKQSESTFSQNPFSNIAAKSNPTLAPPSTAPPRVPNSIPMNLNINMSASTNANDVPSFPGSNNSRMKPSRSSLLDDEDRVKDSHKSESLFPPTRDSWKPLSYEFDAFKEAVSQATEMSKRTLLRDVRPSPASSSSSTTGLKVYAHDYPSFAKDISTQQVLTPLGNQQHVHSTSLSPVVALSELSLLQEKMSSWKQQYSTTSNSRSGGTNTSSNHMNMNSSMNR